MVHLIDKSALIAKIEKIRAKWFGINNDFAAGQKEALTNVLSLINTFEVKEVNEVSATVMVNKYGNRFISSWPGLKEYDDFKKGEEIKIIIPKK